MHIIQKSASIIRPFLTLAFKRILKGWVTRFFIKTVFSAFSIRAEFKLVLALLADPTDTCQPAIGLSFNFFY